jgi:hypothetical protein
VLSHHPVLERAIPGRVVLVDRSSHHGFRSMPRAFAAPLGRFATVQTVARCEVRLFLGICRRCNVERGLRIACAVELQLELAEIGLKHGKTA